MWVMGEKKKGGRLKTPFFVSSSFFPFSFPKTKKIIPVSVLSSTPNKKQLTAPLLLFIILTCFSSQTLLLLFINSPHLLYIYFILYTYYISTTMLTAALASTATSTRPFTTSSETRNLSDSDSSRENVGPDIAPSHLRIVPHLDTSRSLVFTVVERDVTDGTILKIGRFTDKYSSPTRITFKSKVVSRGHAEMWTKNGKVSYFLYYYHFLGGGKNYQWETYIKKGGKTFGYLVGMVLWRKREKKRGGGLVNDHPSESHSLTLTHSLSYV